METVQYLFGDRYHGSRGDWYVAYGETDALLAQLDRLDPARKDHGTISGAFRSARNMAEENHVIVRPGSVAAILARNEAILVWLRMAAHAARTGNRYAESVNPGKYIDVVRDWSWNARRIWAAAV